MGNYVVKKGDTIWGIARAHNIPTADLVKWNNLGDNPNYIQVGQTLKLSADGGSSTGDTKTTTTDNSFKYDDFKYDDFQYDKTFTDEGFKYDKTFTDEGFSYDDYKESDIVTQAKNALNAQLANKPGEYQSQWQAQLDDAMNKILNREKFSYDLNGDVLYQQYKDKYIKQGKMAMGDAIGQASAMTGGYGNSYAQSVGQQAYQAQLENLNDIVPELWQMAYDQYNQEGQDLYNQYAMLGDRENMDYGRYRDSMSDWLTERDYLTGRYDTERGFDYSKYADDRNFAYGKYADDRNFNYNQYIDDKNFEYSKYANDRNFKYNQYIDDKNFEYGKYADDRTLAYGQYSDDRNLAYSEHRNAIEDALAMEKFEYQKEQDRIADEQWQKQYDAVYGNKTSGGSSGGGSSSGGSSGGSSGSGSGSSNGNTNTSGTSTTKSIPDSVRQKASTITNNKELESYLERMEASGSITHDQALELMAEFMDDNEVYTDNGDGSSTISYKSMVNSSNGWTVLDDGGTNWFGIGIDADARVKAPDGQEYRLDTLRKKLQAEGMSYKDATAAIKSLSKNLGI
jgi:hypothetical protein